MKMLLRSASVVLLLLSVELCYSQKCTEVEHNSRIDCAPDHPNDSQVCNQRKCCFEKHNTTNGKSFDYSSRYEQKIINF